MSRFAATMSLENDKLLPACISMRDVYSMFTEIGIGNAMTNDCGFNVLLSSGDYDESENEEKN